MVGAYSPKYIKILKQKITPIDKGKSFEPNPPLLILYGSSCVRLPIWCLRVGGRTVYRGDKSRPAVEREAGIERTYTHGYIYIYVFHVFIYIYIYYIYICVCVCVKMCIYVNLNTHHILYIIGELMFHWKSGKDIGKWCRALTDFEDAKPEDASIFSQRPKKPTGPTVRYPKHPVLRYSLVCCFGLEAASPRHLIVSVKEQVTCQNNRRRVVLVFQSH